MTSGRDFCEDGLDFRFAQVVFLRRLPMILVQYLVQISSEYARRFDCIISALAGNGIKLCVT